MLRQNTLRADHHVPYQVHLAIGRISVPAGIDDHQLLFESLWIFNLHLSRGEKDRIFEREIGLGRDLTADRVKVSVDRKKATLRILVHDQLTGEYLDAAIDLLIPMMNITQIAQRGANATKFRRCIGNPKKSPVNGEN